MLEKTRGICCRTIPYSDHSVVVRVYTEKFGIQSYMVQGVHSRKSRARINLFQPFFLLDMEVQYRQGRNIQQIKDVKPAFPFSQIPFDLIRSSQAIFASEVLTKFLREEEPDPELFRYLFQAACILDTKEEGIANFTVVFLFNLTRYLGILPQLPAAFSCRFFDLESGLFVRQVPVTHACMSEEVTKRFATLFQIGLEDMEKLSLRSGHRYEIIDRLLEYYKIHLDLTGEIRSLAVLKEILT